MMRKILLTSFLSLLAFTQVNAQNVNIPDANFKAYLVGNTAINTNNDGETSNTEAAAFTGVINCENLSITDLTGIEAFTSLTHLKCGINQLTNIDISTNTALLSLDCFKNQLTSLDLSANTALTAIDFNNNNLTSLDVSANNLLFTLAAVNNKLTHLDVSANPALTYFNCRQNSLTSLNIKNGSNNILTNANFNVVNNPNLTCIEVDNVTWSTTNWTSKDYTTSYNTNCGYISEIKDAEMIRLTVYPNPVNDIINIKTDAIIISNSIYDLSGSLVDTFYGNEYAVSHLTNGVYFITVQTQTGTAQHKFVKQ